MSTGSTVPAAQSPFGTASARNLLVLAAVALSVFCFRDTLLEMIRTWNSAPESSHGIVVPFVAAFLIWQRRDVLARLPPVGSPLGPALVSIGLALHFVGVLSTTYAIQQLGFLLVLYGIVLAAEGRQVFRALWVPMLVLVFMVPWPRFLLATLSAQLQLISSAIGVGLIRAFGISVHLEGNVIDLGTYKLEVAEACDGLRYLFPLMTLGFVMTCFYRAAAWKRVLVFLSTIPIAILMNSLRVGVIGVTVEYWGPAMAQGALHEFQGWLVFMGSLGLLLVVMLLLGRMGTQQRKWREIFVIDWPRDVPPRVRAASPAWWPLALTVVLVAAYSFAIQSSGSRVEAKPDRAMLAAFPDRLGPWSGHQVTMEPIYLQTLKLDDYLLADFSEGGGVPVNLYVAWYDSQRAGQAAHSPRSCLPGGGWRIEELDRVEVPGVEGPDGPLHVNRALISTGRDRGLVYYWFQQRGRVVTNEYLVKWYLFVDALTRNRTDGALVRLTTSVAEGEDVAEADARLRRFAAAAVPELSRYVAE